MPVGGARPGAGGPPTNLKAIARIEPAAPGREERKLTVIDVVVESMALGGFLHDAAAQVGVSVETLRRWRTIGSRCLIEITEGQRRRSEMTAHQRNCMALVAGMDRAEAEARQRLLGVVNGLADGGGHRTEVTVKTITPTVDGRPVTDPVEVERVTRTIELGPDASAATWLLAHRWPADFNRTRVEVTGDGGGPVMVDTTSALDKITRHLADIRAAREETDPVNLAAAISGNGGSGSGDHP